jgi:hypothetical protein
MPAPHWPVLHVHGNLGFNAQEAELPEKFSADAFIRKINASGLSAGLIASISEATPAASGAEKLVPAL